MTDSGYNFSQRSETKPTGIVHFFEIFFVNNVISKLWKPRKHEVIFYLNYISLLFKNEFEFKKIVYNFYRVESGSEFPNTDTERRS